MRFFGVFFEDKEIRSDWWKGMSLLFVSWMQKLPKANAAAKEEMRRAQMDSRYPRLWFKS